MEALFTFSFLGKEFIVHIFSSFLLLALCVFVAVLHFELKKRRINEKSTFDNVLLVILFGLIGGRVLFVLFNFPYYIERLHEAWLFWYGGFYFEGAFLFALLYVVWWLKKEKKKHFFGWLDAFIIASLPAQVLVKLGVYFSGESTSSVNTNSFLAFQTPTSHLFEATAYFVTYISILLLFWGFNKEIREGLFFYVVLIMLSILHLIFTPRFGQISFASIGDYLLFPSHILFVLILTGAVVGLIILMKDKTITNIRR